MKQLSYEIIQFYVKLNILIQFRLHKKTSLNKGVFVVFYPNSIYIFFINIMIINLLIKKHIPFNDFFYPKYFTFCSTIFECT